MQKRKVVNRVDGLSFVFGFVSAVAFVLLVFVVGALVLYQKRK